MDAVPSPQLSRFFTIDTLKRGLTLEGKTGPKTNAFEAVADFRARAPASPDDLQQPDGTNSLADSSISGIDAAIEWIKDIFHRFFTGRNKESSFAIVVEAVLSHDFSKENLLTVDTFQIFAEEESVRVTDTAGDTTNVSFIIEKPMSELKEILKSSLLQEAEKPEPTQEVINAYNKIIRSPSLTENHIQLPIVTTDSVHESPKSEWQPSLNYYYFQARRNNPALNHHSAMKIQEEIRVGTMAEADFVSEGLSQSTNTEKKESTTQAGTNLSYKNMLHPRENLRELQSIHLEGSKFRALIDDILKQPDRELTSASLNALNARFVQDLINSGYLTNEELFALSEAASSALCLKEARLLFVDLLLEEDRYNNPWLELSHLLTVTEDAISLLKPTLYPDGEESTNRNMSRVFNHPEAIADIIKGKLTQEGVDKRYA